MRVRDVEEAIDEEVENQLESIEVDTHPCDLTNVIYQ